MQKATKIEAQGGEIVIRNSYDDVAIIPRNLVKKYQAYMKAGCDECIDELVASLPAMSQYAADGTVIPQGKKVKVTLPDGEQAEYSTDSVEYKNLYNSGKLANVVKDKATGEDVYIMPSLKEIEITGKATGAARDMIDTKKSYSKEQYVKEKLPAFAGSLGVTADNLGGNAEGYKRAINTKVAENILKRKPNAKERDLTPYELEIISNSDLDYKIRANLGERFEQGMLSVGNAGSPVEFKNPNLTQDQARREGSPLNIFAPLEAGSRAVRKAIGDTDEPNFLKDIALDPLNLFGLGLIDDLPKLGKAAKVLSKERQIAGSIEDVAEDAALIAASEKELAAKINEVRTSTTLTPQQKEVTLMRLRAATEEGQKRLANYPEGALDRLFNVKLEQDFSDIAYYNPRRNAVVINPNLPRPLQRKYTRHELEHVLQGLEDTGIENTLEGRIRLKPGKLLEKNTPIMVSKVIDKADKGKLKKQSVVKSLITPKYNVIEEFLPEAASYYRNVDLEKSAMVSELQRYAVQHKYVQNEYDVMTPKLMKKMYDNVKKDPKKAIRIFGIINDKEFADTNFEILSEAYNKLLGLTGAGIIGGSITARSLKDQLNKNKSK
jgi:hypothetical protein